MVIFQKIYTILGRVVFWLLYRTGTLTFTQVDVTVDLWDKLGQTLWLWRITKHNYCKW